VVKRDEIRKVGAYEAKTYLPSLLDDVAAGQTITITKHGVPVATLSPIRANAERARVAAEELKKFRRDHHLSGIAVRELIEEGRQR
jgi:prevent-host-death family protein